MADYTVQADEQGVYEIVLTAGTKTTVAIVNTLGLAAVNVQVTVHEAAEPVYVRAGTNVAVKDPHAIVIDTGTWATLNTKPGDTGTLSLISADAATVSVARA